MSRKTDSDYDVTEMMMASERINSGLLSNHIQFLNGDIDEETVDQIIKWIIYENTIKEDDKVLTL